MYRYIIGIVTEQDSNNITLECNNVGYQVFVSNPYSYELNSEYKVYKNTLIQRALNDLNIDIHEYLNGPSAVAFSEDQIAPIKVLANFMKKHKAVTLKVGLVDGNKTTEEELQQLATIPSREGLLTMLAGLSLLLYPTISDYWNSFHQTQAIAEYSENVAGLDKEEYHKLWKSARRYNAALVKHQNAHYLTKAQKEEYEKRAEALIEPLVQKNNFELVDVEYVREGSNWYLRAFIDKPGGITVDDCEVVSREFSELLDKEDFIEDSYIMEVSSPGLGRQLKKDKDLKRSIGEEVEIKLYKGIKQMRKNKEVSVKELSGFLDSFDDNTITIELEDETMMELNRSDIAIIRLAIHF